MIVLRVTADGRSLEFRSEKEEVSLGADRAADLSLPKGDWPPHAAVLRQAGAEVEVRIPGQPRDLSLRVGDEITLGRVHVALVGLLPRDAAPVPDFGDYLERQAIAPTTRPSFELETPSAPPSPSTVLAAGLSRTLPAPASAPTSALSPATAPAGAKPPEDPPGTPPRWLTGSHDFGHELYTALKRSPFWALSAGVHVFLFFLLSKIGRAHV